MARKLRLEFAGACYHIFNRGNYRSDILRDERTKRAFLDCLDEACAKTGWVVHAWCIMSNHYHLALETPEPNLVAGMQWLQGTFAMRFNRYRHENGHLFQGRYNSLVIDPGAALGPLCHYVHLNPLRAGIVTLAQLGQWPWSSVHWLMTPEKRATWYRPTAALEHAGGLVDSTVGQRKYEQYLAWLSENRDEQKRLLFDRMSRGWVLGSNGFKGALVEEHRKAAIALENGEPDLQQTLLTRLDQQRERLLATIGKTPSDLARDPKSAPWKVAVAAELKATSTATNRWLAETLVMGSPFMVSRLVSRYRTDAAGAEPYPRKIARRKA